MLSMVTIEVIIFERVGWGRPDANPRRTPITRNTAAIRKISRLAHGKSRVDGIQTKIKKKVKEPTKLSSKPSHNGQLKRLVFIR